LNINVEEFAAAMGFYYYILVYAVGVIAMAFSVLAFQFKKRVTIILSTFIGQVSWVVHFLLQGDLASAIVCGISAIMLAIFAKKDQWRWATSKITVAIFIGVNSVFSLLTFKVYSDVFPLLAGIFVVIANSRSSEKHLRCFSLVWCLSWLLNSIFKMYPVAFANDLLCTVSTIVALVRYRDKGNITDEKKVD
jgi:hypothetical protein